MSTTKGTSSISSSASSEVAQKKEKKELLLQEQPKMDAAVKSFCSYLVAKNDCNWSLQDALTVSRKVSQHINQHVLSIRSSSSSRSSNSDDDYEITAQVWNELACSKELRITKQLGRTALLSAWDDLELYKALMLSSNDDDNNEEWNDKVKSYLDLFYKLLTASSEDTNSDNQDARLIWDADGGQTELARRAAQRRADADARKQQQQQAQQAATTASTTTTPFIEELEPDDDDKE